MLAAAPSPDTEALELFHLALRLLRQGRGRVPPQLAKHVNAVLLQARALADDPRTAKGQLLPEAIQLALQLRTTAQLRDDIHDIADIGSLTPEQASRILLSLERQGAPTN
jgi:hypothetical protein